MANHKSALKRHRQNLKRALHNSHYRSTMKSMIKKARAAAEAGAPDKNTIVNTAIRMVDKVCGKGIIPKNRASRYVSKLTSMLK